MDTRSKFKHVNIFSTMCGYAGFRIDSMIVIQFKIPYLYCYSNNLKADFSGELHLETPADANLLDQEYRNKT